MVFYFAFKFGVFFLKNPKTLTSRSHLAHVLKLCKLASYQYLCSWSGNQSSAHTLIELGLFMRIKNELWCSNEPQALQKKPVILPKFLSDSSQSVASECGPCAREISRACPWSPYHTLQSVQAQGEAVEEQSWALLVYICAGSRWHFLVGKNRAKEGCATVYLALPFGEEGALEGFFLLHRAGEHVLGWGTPWVSPEMQGCTAGKRGFVCWFILFSFSPFSDTKGIRLSSWLFFHI